MPPRLIKNDYTAPRPLAASLLPKRVPSSAAAAASSGSGAPAAGQVVPGGGSDPEEYLERAEKEWNERVDGEMEGLAAGLNGLVEVFGVSAMGWDGGWRMRRWEEGWERRKRRKEGRKLTLSSSFISSIHPSLPSQLSSSLLPSTSKTNLLLSHVSLPLPQAPTTSLTPLSTPLLSSSLLRNSTNLLKLTHELKLLLLLSIPDNTAPEREELEREIQGLKMEVEGLLSLEEGGGKREEEEGVVG